MLASSSNVQSAASPSSHPRRRPAHLSASLRHESPVTNVRPLQPRAQEAVKGTAGPSRITSIRQSSEKSNHSEESALPSLQKWFDRSNTHPEKAFPQNLDDSTSLSSTALRSDH
jgi:hypothetical protein